MNDQQTQLAIVPLEETMRLGEVLAKSGFFREGKDAAQAVVKILAGRELGFGPVASMTGVNIIQGRVSLSANLIAAAIKRAPRYDYRIVKHTDKVCELAFFENGQQVGTSSFSESDAKQAGLGGDNWRKYPKNMLFARAISNGAKWFTPDIFGGPVYTPDELGAVVDGETGEIIDGETVTVVEPEPAPEPTNGTAPDMSKMDKVAFFRYVVENIPYYRAVNHAVNALRKMGYDKNYEDYEAPALYDALESYAHKAADEEAA